jgi:uncharacterized protein YPO0396
MTTVSVQPTTSEPNEREAFKKWHFETFKYAATELSFDECQKYFQDPVYLAWQHQQKRIDELEANLKECREFDFPIVAKFIAEIELLQAKLNVAVNALENYANGYTTPFCAEEALIEIEKCMNHAKKAINDKALPQANGAIDLGLMHITEALAEINKIGE